MTPVKPARLDDRDTVESIRGTVVGAPDTLAHWTVSLRDRHATEGEHTAAIVVFGLTPDIARRRAQRIETAINYLDEVFEREW